MMRWLATTFCFFGLLLCARSQEVRECPVRPFAAEEIIREHQPDSLFTHLPDVDAAGHAYGWDSVEQLTTIERTDDGPARIMGAHTTVGLLDRTAIFLSADHGGARRTHGPDDPRGRHIPCILVGPHVRQGDLTRLVGLEVNTEDTCATACYLLGLSHLPYSDGKPVLAAYEPSVAMSFFHA